MSVGLSQEDLAWRTIVIRRIGYGVGGGSGRGCQEIGLGRLVEGGGVN